MPKYDLSLLGNLSPELLSLIESAPLPGIQELPKCQSTAVGIAAALRSGACGCDLMEAGLWLLAGNLDRSHSISQSIDNVDGSYWHGIMHRREGDYWNSKYWFRRTGQHAVPTELAAQIKSQNSTFSDSRLPLEGLCQANSVSDALVDLCQAAVERNSEWTEAVKLICWWEWQLLFRHVSN